jgi:hypothetical protein
VADLTGWENLPPDVINSWIHPLKNILSFLQYQHTKDMKKKNNKQTSKKQNKHNSTIWICLDKNKKTKFEAGSTVFVFIKLILRQYFIIHVLYGNLA